MVLASLAAFLITNLIGQLQTLVVFLTLTLIGFVPPPLIASYLLERTRDEAIARRLQSIMRESRKAREPQGGNREHASWQIHGLLALWFTFFNLFGDLILLGLVGVIAAILVIIVLLPLILIIPRLTGSPYFVSMYLLASVVGVALVIALAIVITEVRLRPVFELLLRFILNPRGDKPSAMHIFKKLADEIVVGLKLGRDEIIEFFASLGLGALIGGSGPLGLLYGSLNESVLAGFIVGIFLGLTLSRWKKNPVLLELVYLARARCLIRMKRITEAEHYIKRALGSDLTPSPPIPIVEMAISIGLTLEYQTEDVADYLYENLHPLTPIGDELGPYRDIWIASIQNTWGLIGLMPP